MVTIANVTRAVIFFIYSFLFLCLLFFRESDEKVLNKVASSNTKKPHFPLPY
jgi:hypothetical protein